MPFTAKGTQANRQNALPTTMVQNHGRPVVTLMSSIDQRTRPAGVQPARPIAARSPYWSAAGACVASASVSPERTGSASVELVIASAADEASAEGMDETASKDDSATGVEEPSTGAVEGVSDATLLLISSNEDFGTSGTGGEVGLELDPQPHNDKFREPEEGI